MPYEAYLINPSRRRKRRTSRPRRRVRRNPGAIMNPKRRRRSTSRRSSRKHYRRNPGLPFARGLDIQKAAAIVAGIAASKFIASKLAERIPQLADPKIKAAATLAIGVALGKFLPLPGLKASVGLGGQVAGVSGLLATVAPQFFGEYELSGYSTGSVPTLAGVADYQIVDDPFAPTF